MSMMIFFYLLMLSVFCVCFATDYGGIAGGGIVTQSSEDGDTPVNTTPLRTMPKAGYSQFLECTYEHNFESITETTGKHGIKRQHRSQHRYAFFLQCVKFESSSRSYVFVFFNALPIERLTVTSCDKDDVQQSIFPPRPDYVMNQRYGDVYEDNNDHLVLDIHLEYKDVSGACYERSYRVNYDTTERKFRLKDRKEKISLGSVKCGFVEFICQAPSKELKSTVIGPADPHATVSLSSVLINEQYTTKQLECTVPLPGRKTSDFSYKLICVKTRKNPESQESQEDKESSGYKFIAFINFGSLNGLPMERFAVKSCIEDDIVNGIFPGRLYIPESTVPRLDVKHANGKCYEHVYRQEESKYIGMQHQEKPCPSEVLGWLNPSTIVGSVMWLSCKGPTSASGEPKTLP